MTSHEDFKSSLQLVIVRHICLFCIFLKKKVKALISDGITWALSFNSNGVHLVVDRLASYIVDTEAVDQAQRIKSASVDLAIHPSLFPTTQIILAWISGSAGTAHTDVCC